VEDVVVGGERRIVEDKREFVLLTLCNGNGGSRSHEVVV
jgi:hypothetical protein